MFHYEINYEWAADKFTSLHYNCAVLDFAKETSRPYKPLRCKTQGWFQDRIRVSVAYCIISIFLDFILEDLTVKLNIA